MLTKTQVNDEIVSKESWLQIINRCELKIKYSARRKLFKLEITNTEQFGNAIMEVNAPAEAPVNDNPYAGGEPEVLVQ